jgi:hypothetical protein
VYSKLELESFLFEWHATPSTRVVTTSTTLQHSNSQRGCQAKNGF